MLNWIERIRLKILQRRIIRWEKRMIIIKKFIKQDRKEAKRLLIKDVDDIIKKVEKQ
jgi:hypothetical protein